MRFQNTAFCALALSIIISGPAQAGNFATHPEDNNKPSSSSVRATARGIDTVQTLVFALTRRSVELARRNLAAPNAVSPSVATGAVSRSAAGAPHARLSSRMSGAASHRSNGKFAPASSLVDYLMVLSRTTPGGQVTGRFSDWRSPSIYRSVGGRHNGYDVALKAGSPVVVGWPGRVSAITNWYGREYGITVVSPDGFRTTYGHLSPAVRRGQWLEPGDVVGLIVRDHVDIKMKTASGKPVDFARGVPLVHDRSERTLASGLVAGGPGSETSVFPPLPGPDWTLRSEAVRAALNYLRLRQEEAGLLPAAPTSMLARVRRDLVQARIQLAVEEVPEDVLLAAFLDSRHESAGRDFPPDTLSVGDAEGAGSNVISEWLRRQQIARDARQATPQLKSLLQELGR